MQYNANKPLMAGYQFEILYFMFTIYLYYVTIINKYKNNNHKQWSGLYHLAGDLRFLCDQHNIIIFAAMNPV